jgi:hypothetical protein
VGTRPRRRLAEDWGAASTGGNARDENTAAGERNSLGELFQRGYGKEQRTARSEATVNLRTDFVFSESADRLSAASLHLITDVAKGFSPMPRKIGKWQP